MTDEQIDLLGAFNKLSLSTSSTGDNNCLPTATDKDLKKTSGSSDLPIQSCSSTSSSNGDDGKKVENRENKQETRPRHPVKLYNITIKHPFPKEPIISTKKFINFVLDESFSTQTDLSRPKRIGYFSCHINPDGKTQSYRPDKSSLRYLRYKSGCRVNMNLLEGYDPEKLWGRVPPGEMHFLQWYIQNYPDSTEYDRDSDSDSDNDDNLDSGKIDFVCYTRMLRSFLISPFIHNEDWICLAIKVRGTIILDELDTSERKASTQNQSERERASSYAGYKFEEMITRRFDRSLRPTHDEGNRDSFYIVSKARLNSHSLLYCTRADCAKNKDQLHRPIEEMEFALIKSRRQLIMQYYKGRCFWIYHWGD